MVDPFALAVIHDSLIAIARDMKIMTMKTAYTQLWKEQGDLSCCLMNGRGDIVAQDPNGFPIHVTTMPQQLQGMLEVLDRDGLVPGDVLVTNDPFLGGTHLPDVLIARPLFRNNELYAFACNRGHWADIGGMGPGSYSPATSDIHQEGMIIPPVKLFEAGRVNSGLMDMLMANIRNRMVGLGDLRSQYASCETAEKRLEALITRYGFNSIVAAMDEIIARAEHMTRLRITEFPDGTYHARDCLDGDGRSTEKTWIDVRLTISGSNIVADLTESSDQSAGGMNCSRSAAESAVQYAVKSITDPENPPNAGSYRPIVVRTRRGSLVDAEKPHSMVGFGDVCYRVLDATMTALAPAIGNLAIASGSGSTGTVVVAGRQHGSSRRSYFTTVELASGAYGARASRDGVNAIRYGPGNAGHIPIEADELDNPLFFEAYEIVSDTGGPGKFRGGNGFVRAFRVMADDARICLCADRHETRPPGLSGGQSGANAKYVLDPETQQERRLPSKTPYLELAPGTLVWLQSAGGGGYGDPLERDRWRVASDVKNGYISREAAATEYGFSAEQAPPPVPGIEPDDREGEC